MVGIENKKKAPPCAWTHEGADSHKLSLRGYDNGSERLFSESDNVGFSRLVDELVARTV